MLADGLAGRAMEVEAIVGNTIRIAREHGVKTPLLDGLYTLAKALDSSLARERVETN
jgi:2-dehydropantoate 2-reductase